MNHARRISGSSSSFSEEEFGDLKDDFSGHLWRPEMAPGRLPGRRRRMPIAAGEADTSSADVSPIGTVQQVKPSEAQRSRVRFVIEKREHCGMAHSGES